MSGNSPFTYIIHYKYKKYNKMLVKLCDASVKI